MRVAVWFASKPILQRWVNKILHGGTWDSRPHTMDDLKLFQTLHSQILPHILNNCLKDFSSFCHPIVHPWHNTKWWKTWWSIMNHYEPLWTIMKHDETEPSAHISHLFTFHPLSSQTAGRGETGALTTGVQGWTRHDHPAVTTGASEKLYWHMVANNWISMVMYVMVSLICLWSKENDRKCHMSLLLSSHHLQAHPPSCPGHQLKAFNPIRRKKPWKRNGTSLSIPRKEQGTRSKCASAKSKPTSSTSRCQKGWTNGVQQETASSAEGW